MRTGFGHLGVMNNQAQNSIVVAESRNWQAWLRSGWISEGSSQTSTSSPDGYQWWAVGDAWRQGRVLLGSCESESLGRWESCIEEVREEL
jgi:hypothetical protein